MGYVMPSQFFVCRVIGLHPEHCKSDLSPNIVDFLVCTSQEAFNFVIFKRKFSLRKLTNPRLVLFSLKSVSSMHSSQVSQRFRSVYIQNLGLLPFGSLSSQIHILFYNHCHWPKLCLCFWGLQVPLKNFVFSWFTIFQVYSKVIQLYVPIYI